MCHYITATMASNGDESIVRRLAKASLLKWEPIDNQGVIKQLRSGERFSGQREGAAIAAPKSERPCERKHLR